MPISANTILPISANINYISILCRCRLIREKCVWKEKRYDIHVLEKCPCQKPPTPPPIPIPLFTKYVPGNAKKKHVNKFMQRQHLIFIHSSSKQKYEINNKNA